MKIAGLQYLTTAMEGGLRSMPRGQDGSLDELAQLLRDKARLLDRRENWQRRIVRIDRRLKRIEARERPLLRRVAEKSGTAIFAQVAELTNQMANQKRVATGGGDAGTLAQTAEVTDHKKKQGGLLQY